MIAFSQKIAFGKVRSWDWLAWLLLYVFAAVYAWYFTEGVLGG